LTVKFCAVELPSHRKHMTA